MPKIFDRIKEFSFSMGTSLFQLNGADQGFSSFASVYNDTDRLYYCIVHGNQYEIGIGTFLLPNSLSRGTNNDVLQSSNNNNIVDFTAGRKEVYVTYPANRSVFLDQNVNPSGSQLAFWRSSNALGASEQIRIENGELIVDTSISVSGVINTDDLLIRDNIRFSNNNEVQTEPFIPNQLITETKIEETIQLSGELNNNIGFNKQLPNTFLAGPLSKCDSQGFPLFRPLDQSDIPPIDASNVLYDPDDQNNWPGNNIPGNVKEGLDILAESFSNVSDLFPEALPASGGNADTLDFLDSTDFALVDHVHQNLIYANVVENVKEFTNAINDIVNQVEIFNDWFRFSHDSSNNFPAIPSETQEWTFNSSQSQIMCTVNSLSYIGFISTISYSEYMTEATLLADDSSGSFVDNDALGIVLAFNQDLDLNKEYTLSAIVRRSLDTHTAAGDNTFTFAIIFNYNQQDEKLIVQEPIQLPLGLWNNLSQGIRLRVERDNDVFRVFRSDYDDINNIRTGPGQFLEINLNNDPVLNVFRGPQRYGYSCLSQNFSTFDNIIFENYENNIYNLDDGNVYSFDSSISGYVVDPQFSFSDLGPERFVFNETTEKLFYISIGDDIRNVSNAIDSFREVAVGTEISNFVFNSGTFNGAPYFFETRNGSVRISKDGVVASTIAERNVPYEDPGQIGFSNDIFETNGLEPSGTLPRKMYAFRRSGNDIFIDVNMSGIVQTLQLGTVT